MPPNVPPDAPGLRDTCADFYGLQNSFYRVEKEKGRKVMNLHGLECGARGRNRTGTPCGGGF